MLVRVVPTSRLAPAEIIALYNIHRKRYFEKGFGRDQFTWTVDLTAPYHNRIQKRVHVFGSSTNSIEGYVLSTEQIPLGNQTWSKILEFSTDSATGQSNSSLFLQMMGEITQNVSPNFYLVEVDFRRTNLLKLLQDAGFTPVANMALLERLIATFIAKTQIHVHSSNSGKILERPTKITSAYPSHWMTNYKSY
jgi:hypothetical protein